MLDANFVTALVLGALLGAACVSLLAGSMARRRVADLTAAHQQSIALLQAQFDKRLAETQAGVESRVASALRESEHRHEVAMLAERERISLQHQDNLKATEDRLQAQLAKVESPLTVVVHPFVNTTIDKGLIRNSSVVEVGYKYQLLMQGIPCFPPHDVVVETQSKVEVDESKIKAWGARALEFAEGAAQIQGGGIASTLISVAKTVVQSRK
jgi:hypothetical protein